MSAFDRAPSAVASAEVRVLAAQWTNDRAALAQEMYAFLAARIPAARADEEIAGLTLASCSANIEAVLAMIRLGIPASATEAPVAALEHARQMAARPGGLDDTLRFYRLGHAFFWSRWSGALIEAVLDRDALVVALRETAAFVFDYIDSISARVAAEHVAERERLQRRAAIVRADVVRSLLAGEPFQEQRAENALGYALGGSHVSFVCFTDGDASGLERIALSVGQTLGGARPLLVADGAVALGGWVHADVADAAAVGALLASLSELVHVTLGRPGNGVEGFRASRRQADRARRIVTLAGLAAPRCTSFNEVELVELLCTNVDGARAFMAHQLGALASPSPVAARAREAMLLATAPGGGVTAAARTLELHRNTVLQRLRKGEELRGRPLSEDARDLHLALLLAATLGV